ncbi:MAG: T9SS type A sorting domain-containing protein, partial [Bacteroidetes bacterium]|nr:T9SS type A sorting domain-containing protein [Bacteroidota bacterium]
GLKNPPFLIPANTERTLIAELPVSDLAGGFPLSVFSLTPHAHVVCKSFKAYSYRPGFTDTIPLIDVPRWDFHWQGTYTMRKPLRLGGNRISRAEVVYDNTENNPENPNFPPKDVWWGEKTTDEMLYLFATVALYAPGDENIILDSTLLTSTRPVLVQSDGIQICPNPVQDVLDIRMETIQNGMTDFILTDMQGRTVRQWREKNFQRSRTSVQSLEPGMYVLHLRQGNNIRCVKVVKE